MTIYIYSFLEGETKWSLDAPTGDDLTAVEDGQLEVLRVQDGKVETVDGETGNWSPATEAEFVCTHGIEFHE